MSDQDSFFGLGFGGGGGSGNGSIGRGIGLGALQIRGLDFSGRRGFFIFLLEYHIRIFGRFFIQLIIDPKNLRHETCYTYSFSFEIFNHI